MLKIEKPLEQVWKHAVGSALQSGASSDSAIEAADNVTLAYDSRFGAQTEEKMNATYSLATAIKYIERSALVGKKVIVIGSTDVPGIGIIRDFRNETIVQSAAALIKWESGGPDSQPESWTLVHRVQLIAQFGA